MGMSLSSIRIKGTTTLRAEEFDKLVDEYNEKNDFAAIKAEKGENGVTKFSEGYLEFDSEVEAVKEFVTANKSAIESCRIKYIYDDEHELVKETFNKETGEWDYESEDIMDEDDD